MRIQSFVDGVIVKGSHGAWAFPNETRKLFQVLDRQFLSRDIHFLETSKYLYEFLSQTSFPANCLTSIHPSVMYRRVSSSPPANDPLSVLGSFGTGGRLNIGGSQASGRMTKLFGSYARKRAALYLSEDPTTARKEYGDYGMPGSTAITYEVTFQDPNTPLTVIDLEQAVRGLQTYFPALPAIISKDSLGAVYEDVKVVIATQLLANWLYIGSPTPPDGIVFESTRNPGFRNYCFFFDNDDACKKILCFN
ncbi:MAG: RES family NAD+ phosphorylase [Pseudobdellovibrionaceae bacterium]|nr:RES family NAD+ phosphorylase [Pseudobdellovibrionaceae bacterium]